MDWNLWRGLKPLEKWPLQRREYMQGLSDDVICWMEDDDLGYFWISTHTGIMRVSKREVNLCADGLLSSVNCLSFGKGDGLPTLEFACGLQSAGCKTSDGHLYFASNKGVVIVDPKDVKLNALAPPVCIEAMNIDGHPMVGLALQRTDKSFSIPPGRHRLEFAYTGLSYTVPEKVRFRYRLEGLDSDWTEAGAQRHASFDYVPPGRYVFHVLACNDAGVWNEKGASMAFILLPFFWQTWWFRASLMAAALGMVAAESGWTPAAGCGEKWKRWNAKR